ncbi:MAG TPA: hypothetical protein DD990_03285, partial [Cyanobacteria bacterium UBA11368]|nr:hypothetical protein [Cyanobacteria bacterium UBA11368]
MAQRDGKTSNSNGFQKQPKLIVSTSSERMNGANAPVSPRAQNAEPFAEERVQNSHQLPKETQIAVVQTGWWQQLSLKNKAIICAIAIAVLPGALVGTTTYVLGENGVLIGTCLALGVEMAIAIFLIQHLIRPILRVVTAVKHLGVGNLDTRIKVETEDELGILGTSINQLADRLQILLAEKEAVARQDRLLSNIAWRARQATDIQDFSNKTLAGVRRVLKLDRVIIYRFNSDWSGTVVAESVGPGWTKSMDETIDDPCFRMNYIEQYQNGRVRAINDIYNEPVLSSCHILTLEQ